MHHRRTHSYLDSRKRSQFYASNNRSEGKPPCKDRQPVQGSQSLTA